MENLLSVRGVDALDELARLRAEFDRTGLYPVMLGKSKMTSEEIERRSEKYAEIVENSRSINVQEWFNAHRAKNEGDWPAVASPEPGIIGHLNLSTWKPLDAVSIVLLKVKEPWEAFAAWNLGGWNDCPAAKIQCAIHKFWAEKYGSEVIAISHGVECTVSRPPTTHEECLELAHQQYALLLRHCGAGHGHCCKSRSLITECQDLVFLVGLI